tara:strand:- start:2108 stop:2350 length:243 start_codon:yes stop_codon:yes gene_type:complete
LYPTKPIRAEALGLLVGFTEGLKCGKPQRSSRLRRLEQTNTEADTRPILDGPTRAIMNTNANLERPRPDTMRLYFRQEQT